MLAYALGYSALSAIENKFASECQALNCNSAMKRKLDDNDVPTPVVVLPSTTTVGAQNFESLGLDVRLLQAISHEKFTAPTPVQSQVIPLALEGKDILGTSSGLKQHACDHSLTVTARAKTGSGKTAAYVLPILEGILRKKAVGYGFRPRISHLTFQCVECS